jgi:type IV pilus assembly protein PilE
MKGSKQKGFSLIELMIAVAIVAILAAIAYPAYNDQVTKARRSDAHSALLNMSALMEHYYTENNTYVGANSASDIGGSATSPEGHYNMTISNVTATTYTLTATPDPSGAQASDTTCGALTITSTNVKGPTPATCW